jgi:hypothetical protein
VPRSLKPQRAPKSTPKQLSQIRRNKEATKEKEIGREEREQKANRIGSGRGKKDEALAQESQLLDGFELPFRSSQ